VAPKGAAAAILLLLRRLDDAAAALCVFIITGFINPHSSFACQTVHEYA
jgi:hypothetical protein